MEGYNRVQGFDVDEEQDEFEANQKMPYLPDMDSGRPIRRRKQAARPSDEPIPAAVVAGPHTAVTTDQDQEQSS